MANHKSSDKRVRQTKRKTEVNRRILSALRTFEKKTLKAVEEGNKEQSESFFRTYASGNSRVSQKAYCS